ncbi:MAG TPA: peptidoglycan DD-metalloendopeptidase family protein [Stellaceae bacterium]
MATRLTKGGLALAGLCFSALPALAASHPVHPAAAAAPDALVAQLDTVIQQGIAAARAVQGHELTIGSQFRAVSDADGQLDAKQHALDDARRQAASLLAALERYVHTPRLAALLAVQSPIDRLRSGMLMAAAVPALSERAHMLIAELQRLETLKDAALARQDNLTRDRQALGTMRQRVDQLDTKREDLRRQLLGDDADSDPRSLKQGTVAVDLPDLIQRGDAEAEIRERERHSRAALAKNQSATDPTRPKSPKTFDKAATLTVPIAGPVVQRFGQDNEIGAPAQGVTLAGIGDAAVVAPFDGQVDYIGPFRGYGTILIIDHGGGYHSVVAGLGRVDAKIGEWVVAGEPIGTLPDAAKAPGTASAGNSVTLYFELRQDGRPVDPQLSLADQGGGQANDQRTKDHRVTE